MMISLTVFIYPSSPLVPFVLTVQPLSQLPYPTGSRPVFSKLGLASPRGLSIVQRGVEKMMKAHINIYQIKDIYLQEFHK